MRNIPPITLGIDTATSVVIGVDTHKKTHVVVLLTILGAWLDECSFPATKAGYTALLTWAQKFGTVVKAGVEGTNSYGAGLTRYLQTQNIPVLEVNQPDRQDRRRRGKNDRNDAEAAARSALDGTATAHPKTGDGEVEMLRYLKHLKDSAIKARTQTINIIKADLVTAPTDLRENLADLTVTQLIKKCAALRPGADLTVTNIVKQTLRDLAHRYQFLTTQITDTKTRMTKIIQGFRPALLDQFGVGPDVAATLLITAGDNPERLRTEASFAALCGVSPVDASSGQNQTRRLNRGGDRQANCALHTVALTRLRGDKRTQEYHAKRISQGKTPRSATRCLKRYIARELYKLLKPTTQKTALQAA